MEDCYSSIINEIYSRLAGKPVLDIVYYYYLKELRPIINVDS